jgi:hypothetical protein
VKRLDYKGGNVVNTPVHPSDNISFRAERWIVAQHGKSAIVRLPKRLDDVSALAQHEVLIDGCLYKCSRVDTAMHAPPFRTGEYIALLVEPPED